MLKIILFNELRKIADAMAISLISTEAEKKISETKRSLEHRFIALHAFVQLTLSIQIHLFSHLKFLFIFAVERRHSLPSYISTSMTFDAFRVQFKDEKRLYLFVEAKKKKKMQTFFSCQGTRLVKTVCVCVCNALVCAPKEEH